MSESIKGDQRDSTIFLVEPAPEKQTRFQGLLSGSGWRVVPCDGTGPFPHAGNLEPSVVLISAESEGFDAVAFIRKVRSQPNTEYTPIIVLAGEHNELLLNNALEEGADDVAFEPFSKERLTARVEAYICLANLRREDQEYVSRSYERMRLSERRYRSLVSATAAIVWVAAEDGRIIEQLPMWENFTGQKYADYRDFGWLNALHPDDREAVEGLWQTARAEELHPVNAEFRLRRHDGEYRAMQLKTVPVRNKREDLLEWVGAMSDISETRSAQEDLRESEQKLRLIFDSSTDFAIFTMDMEGKVTTWNAGAERLLGYTGSEICGTDFHQIFTDEDVRAGAPDQEMQAALETGRGMDQRWHKRKDGSLFWADGLVMPLRDKKKNNEGYLKIIRDFTEQKKAQDDLKALTEELERRVEERTKALEESETRLRLLVIQLNKIEQMERHRIAAELHDGLAQTLTAGQLTLESAILETADFPTPSALLRLRDIITEATRKTRGLMTELTGPPMLEHDDLIAAVSWVAERMRDLGLSIKIVHNKPEIPLEKDLLTLLFQSIRELLLNVHKYAGVQEATIVIEHSDDRLVIEVADKGNGFLPETIVGNLSGNGGFGLLNIRERLRWLNGTLEIDSHPGDGTSVRLSLPLENEC